MVRRLMKKGALLALPLWTVSGASPGPRDVQSAWNVLYESYVLAGFAMAVSWGDDGLETIMPVGLALGSLGRELADARMIRRSSMDCDLDG